MEVGLRNYKATTTHMPILIKALQNTKGPVLELGTGFFSTPLLHWLCAEEGRELISYEKVPEFYQYARQFKSKNHRVRLVEDWDKIDIEREWAVVLIDHDQFRRTPDALRVKDLAEFIVMHDTQSPDWVYNYSEVFKQMKYIYHGQYAEPWTSVVSNKRDMEIFKND